MVGEIAGGDVRIIPDVVRTSGRDVLTVLSVVRKGTDIDRRILDIIVAGVEIAFGSVSVLETSDISMVPLERRSKASWQADKAATAAIARISMRIFS